MVTMGLLRDPLLTMTIALALALLFAVAAVHKMRDLRDFADAMADYGLLPPVTTAILSRLLPVAELLTAASLLLPATRVLGALAATALLVTYAGAMAVSLWRGKPPANCGCHLAEHDLPVHWSLVSRNLFVACAALSLALMAGTGDVDSAVRPLLGLDYLTVAAAVVTIALLYALGNLLIANAHRQRELFHA